MTDQTANTGAAEAATEVEALVAEQKAPSLLQQIVEAEESSGELVPVEGAMTVQDPENIVPIRPKDLSDEDNGRIQAEAEELAQAIFDDPSGVEITSKVYAIGESCMTSNTRHVELMEAKIGPVMAEVTTGSIVPKTLTQIKAQLDLVNPTVVGTEEVPVDEKAWVFFTKTVNVVVSTLPGWREMIMEMINERRDTVKTTVDTLRGHLFVEKDKALKNAIELGMVGDQLRDTQDDLQEATYFGALVWQRLNELREGETDPSRQQALMYLVNDLAMRVIDLQTVDQLNMQSRMGAETLINNCRGLQTLVHRVANILLPSVMNALIVKAGAVQQAQLAGASRDIMTSASRTIRQTAGDIRKVSTDVARMNTESMLDLDELEAACGEYEAMQADIEEIIANAERNARGITNRLGKLNERTRDRVDPMTAARRAREQAGA